MLLATLEHVMVAVDGVADNATVSLGVAEEGLEVGGFGLLSWQGARVAVEDLSPRGVRIRVTPPAGAPSTFFVSVLSMPDGLSMSVLAGSLERLAEYGGAEVEGSLTAA